MASAGVSSVYSLSLVTPSTVIDGQTSGPFSTEARIILPFVTVQTVQGRQTQGYAGSGVRSNAIGTRVTRNRGTNTKDQAKVVRCYNCQEEGHMARQSFQTDDLDAFDFDCDEAPSISADLMAKLSAYDSDVLSEVIVDRNAKVADFENQIQSLKLLLNATVESHKTLSTTVDALKMESKAKEDKYLDEIIELENKKKSLDNVVYKMGQST
ncbi:retrovirus-related pol polyprotein from transposon TNT 1-94 [Tanacetum coccineum]